MFYKKQIDVEEVARFTQGCGPHTKLYVGCDSECLWVGEAWHADYITAVVVHVNGNRGCKIFGAVERERIYDRRTDRPRMRLMNEVYKVANLYLELSKVVEHEIEVHLDINPNEIHGSSVVINEAVGYIRGMCNVIPMVKPKSFAATYAADRYKELFNGRVAA